MLTTILVMAGLLAQSNSANVVSGSPAGETAWSRLGQGAKCGLLRAVLETRRTKAPTYCMLQSECIGKWAKLEGRLLVNVGVRWDVNGVKQVEPFPGERESRNSAESVCGWSDVLLQEGPKVEKQPKGSGLWKLDITFYPIEKPATVRFAFWARLVPTWRLPRNRVADSGCPPEYGFAQMVDGRWIVEFDRAARSYVPIAPALKSQTSK